MLHHIYSGVRKIPPTLLRAISEIQTCRSTDIERLYNFSSTASAGVKRKIQKDNFTRSKTAIPLPVDTRILIDLSKLTIRQNPKD